MTNTTLKKTKPTLPFNNPVHLGLKKLAKYFEQWSADLDKYFEAVADLSLPIKTGKNITPEDIELIIAVTTRVLLITKHLADHLYEANFRRTSYERKYSLEKAEGLDDSIAKAIGDFDAPRYLDLFKGNGPKECSDSSEE